MNRSGVEHFLWLPSHKVFACILWAGSLKLSPIHSSPCPSHGHWSSLAGNGCWLSALSFAVSDDLIKDCLSILYNTCICVSTTLLVTFYVCYLIRQQTDSFKCNLNLLWSFTLKFLQLNTGSLCILMCCSNNLCSEPHCQASVLLFGSFYPCVSLGKLCQPLLCSSLKAEAGSGCLLSPATAGLVQNWGWQRVLNLILQLHVLDFSSVMADQCKGRCWVKGLWKYLIMKILKLKAKASDYACREHPQDCLLHHTPRYAVT